MEDPGAIFVVQGVTITTGILHLPVTFSSGDYEKSQPLYKK